VFCFIQSLCLTVWNPRTKAEKIRAKRLSLCTPSVSPMWFMKHNYEMIHFTAGTAREDDSFVVPLPVVQTHTSTYGRVDRRMTTINCCIVNNHGERGNHTTLFVPLTSIHMHVSEFFCISKLHLCEHGQQICIWEDAWPIGDWSVPVWPIMPGSDYTMFLSVKIVTVRLC